MNCFDARITQDIWTWTTWSRTLCPVNAARITFLQNALNFTVSIGYYDSFPALIKFEYRTELYEPFLMRSSDWTPSIIYCQIYPRLPRGWTVWLSPFDLEVWVMMGLTGAILAYFKKTGNFHVFLRRCIEKVLKLAMFRLA